MFDLTRSAGRRPGTVVIRRHTLVTRLTHWLNAFCICILLMSGLQIFNAHSELYWGRSGQYGDPAAFAINAVGQGADKKGQVSIAGMRIPTTGVLGVSDVDGQPTGRAFPTWATMPSLQDIAGGRHWHFFFAWLFVINGAIYVLASAFRRHFSRDLAPTRAELGLRHLWHEIVDHARLRFPKGEEARHYNALQKLTYLVVIFVLLPLMVLTGLTMSPGIDAALPHVPTIFGGRQSARTIHFITASLIVLFVVVHLVMVVLSGTWNNIRSMITGHYGIQPKEPGE